MYLQVMESRSICFLSIDDLKTFTSKVGEDNYSMKSLLNSLSSSETYLDILVEDLYEYFEVKLNDFQVRFLIAINIFISIFLSIDN